MTVKTRRCRSTLFILIVLLPMTGSIPDSYNTSEVGRTVTGANPQSIGQDNPCPVNPYTQVQWIYDPANATCTYSRVIAGERDTGQQTDIVMGVVEANAYAKSAGDPRTLFLKPAELLNNRALTNMSDEALAALVYAQVFVEEKWFKDYNWVHPYWNSNRDPEGGNWPGSTSLNAKRYAPVLLGALNDWAADITKGGRPYRLSGFGFGIGNQLLGQTWDSARWYLEYLRLPGNRYGLQARPFAVDQDPTLETLARLMQIDDPWLPAPDIQSLLRNELLDVGQSQLWNTLRFLWAGARQREGTYADNRSADEKERQAIDYSQVLGKPPGGRPQSDVSAFSLMTTVYTDAITVPEVTGYGQRYLARDARSLQAWKDFVSERNKAIRNVELLGNTSIEGQYRIQQALAVGPFITQYADPARGDFLPYAREEVEDLVKALLFEINNQDDPWVSGEALKTLNNAKLLQEGYLFYTGQQLRLTQITTNGQIQYVLENH